MTDEKDCCKCTTPRYVLTLRGQGPQGRQGIQGIEGFSPKINVAVDNYSTYKLEILTADGTITTPNLKQAIPQGGTPGQVLTKISNQDGDCIFQNLPIADYETQGIITIKEVDQRAELTVGSRLPLIESKINDEAATRKSEDNQLKELINNEEHARNSDIDRVTSLINKETENRLEKDTILQTQVTTNHNDINELIVNLDTTDTKVNGINELVENLETNKQDKLIAGDNITIEGNTISASGGSIDPSTVVTIADDQFITGTKKFYGIIQLDTHKYDEEGNLTTSTSTAGIRYVNTVDRIYKNIIDYQPSKGIMYVGDTGATINLRTTNLRRYDDTASTFYQIYDKSNLVLPEATATDTQEVRQGTDGKLYTAPGGGGTPEAIDGGNAESNGTINYTTNKVSYNSALINTVAGNITTNVEIS